MILHSSDHLIIKLHQGSQVIDVQEPFVVILSHVYRTHTFIYRAKREKRKEKERMTEQARESEQESQRRKGNDFTMDYRAINTFVAEETPQLRKQ